MTWLVVVPGFVSLVRSKVASWVTLLGVVWLGTTLTDGSFVGRTPNVFVVFSRLGELERALQTFV